jgi:hypothetical protein
MLLCAIYAMCKCWSLSLLNSKQGMASAAFAVVVLQRMAPGKALQQLDLNDPVHGEGLC